MARTRTKARIQYVPLILGVGLLAGLGLTSRGRQRAVTALSLEESANVLRVRPSAAGQDACMVFDSASLPHPAAGRHIQQDRTAHAAHVTAMYRSMSQLAVDRCGANTNIVFVAPRGGLADRFRGMVQLFYYALLSNRGYAMDWEQPYQLTDFFEVASFARGGPGSALPLLPMEVTTEFFQDGHDIRVNLPANASVTIQSANHRWVDIVRNPHLRPAAIQYGLIGLTRSQLFRLAIDVLIVRPRPAVLSEADAVLAAMGMPRSQRATYLGAMHDERPARVRASQAVTSGGVVVGVQIRTGAHGASWQSKDPPRHSLGTVACFAAEVVRDCRVWGKCYVVLTSDSEQATSLFKAHIDSLVGSLGVVIQEDNSGVARAARAPDIRVGKSSGEIMHVYRTDVNGQPPAADIWLKTMVDWYLLRQADALVLSRSGFGWMAAWAGGTVNVRQLALDPQSDACAWYHLPPVGCHENLYMGVGVKCNA